LPFARKKAARLVFGVAIRRWRREEWLAVEVDERQFACPGMVMMIELFLPDTERGEIRDPRKWEKADGPRKIVPSQESPPL
jgi:hypothetical protein